MSLRPSTKELSGMTVNERMFACGLMNRWDVAKRDRRKDEMVSLLCEVALSKEDASWTAEQVLRRGDGEEEGLHEPVARRKKDHMALWITISIAIGAAGWLATKLV